MKLSSSAFLPAGSIPPKYTCQGSDISPPLEIEGVPSQAKSLVLILDDPDVPASVRKEKMWDHWVVFNIPPATRFIPENTQPQGVPGKNTDGGLDYQGPCPPDREHRYFFKLYALDTDLALQPGATKAEVEQAMRGHILASAELMGKYVKS
jgi:Raf kinase inhibitor-like YbhB/YbcL family protein